MLATQRTNQDSWSVEAT